MKAVVVYKSKTGFVKKYAEWIAQELSADLFEASAITIDKLKEYDAIVYGGGLYIAGINGVKMITQHLDMLKGKKIAVYATGLSPERPEAMRDVTSKNFTPEQLQHIRFFYLRGGFDSSKHSLYYKMLMKLLEWSLKFKQKRKKVLTSDELGILDACKNKADFSNKNYIKELVAYIKA